MIKRYSSPARKLLFNYKKDGKPKILYFNGYDQERKRCWVIVTDPDIQKQLEEAKDFNVYYELDYATDEIPQELAPPEKQEFIEVLVGDVMEAKRWLNSKGVTFNKMKNRETVDELAHGMGYHFSYKQ